MVVDRDLLKRPKRSEMTPMMVMARLQAGVISDGLLPLDAVLYYGWHRMLLGPRYGSSTRELSDPQHEGGTLSLLPVARVNEHTPDWFYACSCAVWDDYVDGESFWVKRFPVRRGLDFLREQKRVPVSGGIYRSYHVPVYYRFAPVVKWYVVGVLELVRQILGHVNAIGKKTEMGWGFVLWWDVVKVDYDWSVYGERGELMRPVPSKGDDGVLYGIRPPYWLGRNQRLCEMPAGFWRGFRNEGEFSKRKE